ncbi:MAG: PEP-CTERM sorting domain-containing protein [Phycisphaeraceae bacterium]|nr:PEP-CTERM sorting domain-containing protein [Phycisphaeraceae bacterium]
MVKTLMVSAAAVTCLGAAALAANEWNPALDKPFQLGTFQLTGGTAGPANFFSFFYTAQGNEVGFSFSGIYSESSAGSWASDTRLEIFRNGNLHHMIGGFSNPGAPWDFQGGGSDLPGAYAHGVGGSAPNGNNQPDWSLKGAGTTGDVWEFRFSNGWNSASAGTLTWTEAMLTIHKVPAPGALALIGLAGLAGGRRRRA